MNPVCVMVAHVIAKEPESFIQRDHMVQDLPPAASDPAFGDTVLPGCLRTGWLRAETRSLQELHDGAVEFRIAIEDGVTIRAGFRKCLAQLLHDPVGSRVTRDIEVQNPAPAMGDNEKAIEDLEGQGRHGESPMPQSPRGDFAER